MFGRRPVLDVSALIPADDAITILDGGARSGLSDLLVLHPICAMHCFEPSPNEAAAIKKLETASAGEHKQGRTFVYPKALAEKSGSCALNISRRPGATSCLLPNATLLDEFSADHWSELKDITETIVVPAVSLEDFLSMTGEPWIDFCKLDTQGTELAIFRGAGARIGDISVIKTEVNFLPIYDRQTKSSELFGFLEQSGFSFVDVKFSHPCRRFHVDAHLPPWAYRLVWGNVIFMRNLPLGHPRRLHQALVLAALGYLDPALHVLRGVDNPWKSRAEAFIRALARPASTLGVVKRAIERSLGIEISWYAWRSGKQVRSMPPRAGI